MTSWAISAALTRAFVRMHPRVIQVRPIGPGSKSVARAPRLRASSAAEMPAIPPTMTATSTRSLTRRSVDGSGPDTIGLVELAPFRIERWYERYEFATELMLSSSDCESVGVGELLSLEDDARERLDALLLGYTEVPGSAELRDAIAAIYETVGRDDVVALVAAEEGIFAVEHAVLGRGDHAVVEVPCYESALAVARSTGAEVDVWRRSYADGWAYDLDELERLLRVATRLVYVNTPHNPTGTSMPPHVLDRVVELCAERGAVLLCDEVYRELEHDPATRLPAACDLYERAVSLGSVSKTYGLPGLRTGWIACRDASLRDAIVAVKLYTTICSSAPSELLSALALRHRERFVDRNRTLVLDNLARADAFVASHAELVAWVRPTASPIGFPRLTVPDTQAFCEALAAEAGVLLLPGEVYDEPGHVRVGLGRERVPEAFDRLERFFATR
jgi:aspartate/methionine/tyrosine aminotransferase